MLLAGIAYFIRDWRNLQLAISAPGFLLVFYIWWGETFINFRIWQFSLLLPPTFHLFFPSPSALCLPARVLPQSARWLLANDRKEEAIALLRKAALVNGRVLPPTLHVCLSILNFFLYFFPLSVLYALWSWPDTARLIVSSKLRISFLPLRSWQRDVAKTLVCRIGQRYNQSEGTLTDRMFSDTNSIYVY